MGTATGRNRSTSSEPESSPKTMLATRNRATPLQIKARITALALHCPTAPMTDDEARVWMQDICEDLGHLSDAEIAYGCARYRRSGNKFFPASGELLALCRNQFDGPRGKSYTKLEDLPPPMDPEKAKEMVEKTYRKYGYSPVATREPSGIYVHKLSAQEEDLLREKRAALMRDYPPDGQEEPYYGQKT